jgi:AraC-like DNA-binding protein/quercetin dioxygenase-like cupin family protein
MTIAARPVSAPPARPPRRVSVPDHIATTRSPALNGVDVVLARYGPRRFPAHFHQDYEVGVVTAGACRILMRGEDHLVPAGSVVVINPREVHAVEPADPRGWEYSAVFPSEAAIRELRGAVRLRGPVVADRPLASRLARIPRLLAGAPRDASLEAELRAALGDLPAGPADQATPASEPPAVRHIRGYLEQRHAEPIRLKQLSALSGLTLYHMVRVFRAATGLPPHAYLSQVRLGRAAALLREGYPICGVAFQTGFSDQSHLTRCFKRTLGVTPGQYRRGVLAGTGA